LIALLLLVGCASEWQRPVAASQAERLVAVSPEPTATLRQLVIPAAIGATATPAIVNPTSDPQPATPTSQPAAVQPLPGLIGPGDFPSDVNPLTGEKVPDPALLQRRPLAIKIANMARVRPQAGLNQADLVFEHYSEGGITRFTAIFYTNDARRVGSVRSARLIDLEIPLMYDAALAFSGSSYPIKQMLSESSFFDQVISPDFGHSGFWRTNDAKNPSPFHVDSLFTDTPTLRQILAERGQERSPELQNGMAFHPDPPPGGTPARDIEIIYTGTGILWEYQPRQGRYYRWSDGQKHMDVSTNQQLNFKNIIVVKAVHLNTEMVEDTGGSPSIQIQIWGQGPAVIFRDGQRYEATWRRDDPHDMLTYYDQDGQMIPLAPGNTFVELVPLEFSQLISRP
jgi:hypothetical protein